MESLGLGSVLDTPMKDFQAGVKISDGDVSCGEVSSEGNGRGGGKVRGEARSVGGVGNDGVSDKVSRGGTFLRGYGSDTVSGVWPSVLTVAAKWVCAIDDTQRPGLVHNLTPGSLIGIQEAPPRSESFSHDESTALYGGNNGTSGKPHRQSREIFSKGVADSRHTGDQIERELEREREREIEKEILKEVAWEIVTVAWPALPFLMNELHLALGRQYPFYSSPQLFSMPTSYTQLHSQLTAISGYSFPALCLICGAVMDANGKGKCAAHSINCNKDGGIVFLLQVS